MESGVSSSIRLCLGTKEVHCTPLVLSKSGSRSPIQLDPTVRHEEKRLLHGLVDERRSVTAADDTRDFPRTQLAHAVVKEQRILRACPGPPVEFCFHFLQPRDLRLGLLLRLVEDPTDVRFQLFCGTGNNRFHSSGEWHF